MLLLEAERAWHATYFSRHPELPDEILWRMARAAAKRGDIPPPKRKPAPKAALPPPFPPLKDVLVDAVGYVGAVEAWDLKRRLLKRGGLQRIMDTTAGTYGAKIGGVALICTGAGGVLTSIGCALQGVVSGDFMSAISGCWTGVLTGCAMVGAGFVALDLSGKAAEVIETAKAASVIQIALSEVPPTPTTQAGVGQAEIAHALDVVNPPPGIPPSPPPTHEKRGT